MKDFKNKKNHVIAQRNNSKQLPPPLRDSAEQKYASGIFLREVVQKGGGYNPSSRKAAFTSGYRRAAFTLAEVLITLAVIGIVAVLTIPSMVKSHNERAWSTAKDVFSKKLDIAMKQMNTDGTLTGYETTADFVNALKKNIKINQVCTDDVTKCFAKNITFGKYNPQVVNISNNALTLYTNAGQDWAETVGVRFANGVNALIAYNKNCSDDPYNNQYSPSVNCIGIVYDVQANKQPNTYGKDIDINKNVSKIAGKGLCEYELTDGTCFSKILAPGTGYSALSTADCTAAKEKGEIDVESCYANNYDYYAGAVLACGGKKTNLPTASQLTTLAQEVYNDTSITSNYNNGLILDKEKAAAFLAKYPDKNSWFAIWSSQESSNDFAYNRFFHSIETRYTDSYRFHDPNNYSGSYMLAVCVDSQE